MARSAARETRPARALVFTGLAVWMLGLLWPHTWLFVAAAVLTAAGAVAHWRRS